MAREWWEGEFFSSVMAEALFDAKRVAQAKPEVEGLIRLAKLKKGARVLDAACGIGRHSLELARRGFDVTGVDSTAAYIQAAQRKARAERLGAARFEHGELRDLFRHQGHFDLVINLFTSFGYYRSERDNGEALRQMAAALKPGGRLVMELQPRESIEANFRERDWQPFSQGYLIERREWIQGGRRLRNDWALATAKGLTELRWDLRIYAVPELKAMFRRAGLRQVQTARDFQGRPWKLGERLIIRGVK